MTVCIVGSRKLFQEDDYGSNAWSLLAPNLTIYGFDADADACNEANAALEARNIDWKETHIPLALAGEVGISTLHVTGHPSCSSLYPPNEAYISRLGSFQESMKLDFTMEVETTTLNEFCHNEKIEEVDFLQIDVQGADLDVLKGATNLLEQSVLGLQIEVEFSPLYLNQPLFTDVDLFLRNLGFSLFDLITENPWCRVPRACSPLRSVARAGQLTWADACYLRDPIQQYPIKAIASPDRILKLACLADLLQFPDYGLELLAYLTVHYGNNPAYNCASVILESLSQYPDLVKQGLDSLPIVVSIRDRIHQAE